MVVAVLVLLSCLDQRVVREDGRRRRLKWMEASAIWVVLEGRGLSVSRVVFPGGTLCVCGDHRIPTPSFHMKVSMSVVEAVARDC